MGDIATILLSNFGIRGKAIKQWGYFFCKTERGHYKIYKTSDSHQVIRQRYELLEKLAASGFSNTDRIVLSTQGMTYVQLGRETYVMSKYIEGRELNLDCLEDVVLATESLAQFHIAARGLNCALSQSFSNTLSLLDVFAKDTAFLAKMAKQVNNNSRLLDFDVMFVKNISHYINKATESQELLKKTDYAALHTTALEEGHICHNALKEENLPITNDMCYLVNFKDAVIDTQITDLASFLRRYARRSNKTIPLKKLMDVYDRINPLPNHASQIIHAQLVHPWQFIKIVQEYYSKKRGWAPAALMGRIQSVLEEQERYHQYIENIK